MYGTNPLRQKLDCKTHTDTSILHVHRTGINESVEFESNTQTIVNTVLNPLKKNKHSTVCTVPHMHVSLLSVFNVLI